jgi:hypothetical protein
MYHISSELVQQFSSLSIQIDPAQDIESDALTHAQSRRMCQCILFFQLCKECIENSVVP